MGGILYSGWGYPLTSRNVSSDRLLMVTPKTPIMDSLLPRLLSPSPDAVQECVAMLMSKVQSQCEELLEALIKDPQCDQYLAALCRFLHTANIR